MTAKTPAELIAQYNATLTTNGVGDISGKDVRDSQIDQTDSWDALKVDKTEINSLVEFDNENNILANQVFG